MEKEAREKPDGERVVSASLRHCLGYPVPTLSSLSPDRKDRADRGLPAELCRLFG